MVLKYIFAHLFPLSLPLSLSFFSVHLHALGYYPSLGTVSLGTGGCALLYTDAFTAANNYALMPLLKKPAMGFSATSIPGYGNSIQRGYCFVLPLKHIAYGVHQRSYGNDILRDQTIGAGVAHALNPKLSFGIGAGYHHYSIVNYGRIHAFSLNVSFVSKLSTRLTTAASLFNPFAAGLGSRQAEKLDRTMRIGAKYDFNKLVWAVTELEKSTSSPLNFKSGIHYQFSSRIYCSAGYSSLARFITLGLGFRNQRLSTGMAIAVPASGPVFTSVSMNYEIGK